MHYVQFQQVEAETERIVQIQIPPPSDEHLQKLAEFLLKKYQEVKLPNEDVAARMAMVEQLETNIHQDPAMNGKLVVGWYLMFANFNNRSCINVFTFMVFYILAKLTKINKMWMQNEKNKR